MSDYCMDDYYFGAQHPQSANSHNCDQRNPMPPNHLRQGMLSQRCNNNINGNAVNCMNGNGFVRQWGGSRAMIVGSGRCVPNSHNNNNNNRNVSMANMNHIMPMNASANSSATATAHDSHTDATTEPLNVPEHIRSILAYLSAIMYDDGSDAPGHNPNELTAEQQQILLIYNEEMRALLVPAKNRPLSSELQHALQIFPLSGAVAAAIAKEHEPVCSICLEEFSELLRASKEKAQRIKKEDAAETVKVCRLPCNHFFCLTCLQPWLAEAATCPVCRDDLTVSVASPAYAELPAWYRAGGSSPDGHRDGSPQRARAATVGWCGGNAPPITEETEGFDLFDDDGPNRGPQPTLRESGVSAYENMFDPDDEEDDDEIDVNGFLEDLNSYDSGNRLHAKYTDKHDASPQAPLEKMESCYFSREDTGGSGAGRGRRISGGGVQAVRQLRRADQAEEPYSIYNVY